MKYTRADLTGRGNKVNFSIILKFFIIIPLVAIFIGGAASKYIIVPYLSKNIATMVNTVVHNYSDKFYMLQVGVFSNKSNAEFLSRTINDLGYNSVIINTDDGFRVITDVSEDKNYIDEISSKIKDFGFTSVTNEIDFSKLNFNSTKFNKEINNYMTLINRIFSLQLKLKINSKDDNLINELITDINNLNAEFTGLNNIKDENLLKTITEFHNGFITDCNTLTKNVNTENKDEIYQSIANEAVKINKLSIGINSLLNKMN